MPGLRKRRGLPAIVVIVTLVASGVLALVWTQQRRLIYFPSPGPVPPAAVLPGGRDVTLHTEDGLRLGAWFLPAGNARPGPAVLVFNGNAGDRSTRAPLAVALAGAGLSVLLFDYRGYGGNPGRPSQDGLAADARAARDGLIAQPEVDPDRVAYFGESLGAAVAVGLAVQDPPAALVLRSPFTSLVDVGRMHFPWLPVRLLLIDRYPSIDRIGSVEAPVLVIAGDRDAIVPAELSRRLYDAAPEPKRFVPIAGADHNSAQLLDGRRMIDEVVRFLSAAGVT